MADITPIAAVAVAVIFAALVYLIRSKSDLGNKSKKPSSDSKKVVRSRDLSSDKVNSSKTTATAVNSSTSKTNKADALKARKDKLAAKLKEREETLAKLSSMQSNKLIYYLFWTSINKIFYFKLVPDLQSKRLW